MPTFDCSLPEPPDSNLVLLITYLEHLTCFWGKKCVTILVGTSILQIIALMLDKQFKTYTV